MLFGIRKRMWTIDSLRGHLGYPSSREEQPARKQSVRLEPLSLKAAGVLFAATSLLPDTWAAPLLAGSFAKFLLRGSRSNEFTRGVECLLGSARGRTVVKFGKSYKANRKSYHCQCRFLIDIAAIWAIQSKAAMSYHTLSQIACQSGASNGLMRLMRPPVCSGSLLQWGLSPDFVVTMLEPV